MNALYPFPALQVTMRPRIHRCEASWQWQPAPLRDYDLWHVLDGVGQMQLNGTAYPLASGVTFLLQPDDRLVATHDASRRLTVFATHFEFRDDNGAAIRLPGDDLPRVGARVQDIPTFAALAYACAACAVRADPLSELRTTHFIEMMLLQLWDEASRPGTPEGDLWLQELTGAIRRDPGREWHVEELAQRACLSPSQFTRRFRQAMGMSPAHFCIRTRLDRARQLMLETRMSLEEIAGSLGYSSATFFGRQFKRYFNCTPSEFRGATPAQRSRSQK